MTAMMTSSAYPRLFTQEGKHCMSSDDESDAPALPLYTQRKRRKTFAVPPKPLSPKLDSSDDEDEPDVRRTLVRRRRGFNLPESDRRARQRCLDYLLSAIDAVWAEYCDSTSHAEEQIYMPCSPVSEDEFAPSSSGGHRASVSDQPHSVRLMRLKERLLDAKYFMNEIVARSDPDSSAQFWKRWDILKYSIAEVVEGEDDEECDSVIEDLEAGRYFA